MSELEALFAEQAALMQTIHYREGACDPSRIRYFENLLDQLDVVDTSLLSIYDLSIQDHVYFSRKYAAVLGWDLDAAHEEGVAYVNQRFHPDDMLYLTRSGVFFMKWALAQPVEARRDFKHVARYRMLDGHGHFVPVVEQQSVLELDADGNIWLVLSVIDRAPADEKFVSASSRAVNVKTGQVVEPASQESHLISPREREIMKLISGGMASKQVAEALFLSVHTVNTHRQRILSKTGTSSMTEAVHWAMERRLLS